MNKQIFKKCKVLGKYYELTVPLAYDDWHVKYYDENRDALEYETKLYGQIYNDREMIGGNNKIHKIETYETKRDITKVG